MIVPERDEREPASARAVADELVGVTWGTEATRAAGRRDHRFTERDRARDDRNEVPTEEI